MLALLVFAPVASAAPDLGLDEPVRLNPNITVSSKNVRLGDVFLGHPAYEDEVIAAAPAPGQRITLESDWLANIARTYGVDWRPKDSYDRAVVYRAGRTVTPADILAAFKADLVAKGMPEHTGLRAGADLPTLVVPEEAVPSLTVRESYFDPVTHSFSAIGEFIGPEGKPQFLRVRGSVVNTVNVVVLKTDVTRPNVITSDMVTTAEVPESAMRRDTIVDAENLIGKSPNTMIHAGQPIREAEVSRMNLVDIPVLRSDLNRDDVITEKSLTWATMNANDLPNDVVTTTAYLIGKSPRHMVAANAPIRRGDVLAMHQVTMAVAARDLQRGATLDGDAVSWVPTGDDVVAPGVIVDEAGLVGRITTHQVRAGQPLRAFDVTRPVVIPKDKLVTIIYSTPVMQLSVRGKALEDGAAQQAIQVANANSKSVVLAEVVDANTVRVTAQQNAMR
jgi:flagella basal body P-ring formation protein FlgA